MTSLVSGTAPLGPSEIAGDRVVIVATAAIVDCHAFMICSLCGLQPDAFAHGAGTTINGTSPWERHNMAQFNRYVVFKVNVSF